MNLSGVFDGGSSRLGDIAFDFFKTRLGSRGGTKRVKYQCNCPEVEYRKEQGRGMKRGFVSVTRTIG